jgi:peptidoglycan/LPS O-acetylase OafA/YrhL
MVVLIGHLGFFFPSAERFGHLAHIAVCIFFVLSGFVIRMITRTRIFSIQDFLIDRASRIYSVVIPALAFTFLCEGIGALLMQSGSQAQASPASWGNIPVQVIANLTFTAQCWGYEANPLWNSPFWSLSFECIYYVLFALLLYRKNNRFYGLLFALIAIVSGPAIVMLFPIWLAGCLTYDIYIWLDQKKYAFLLISFCLAVTLAATIVFRHPISYLLQVTDLPHREQWLQQFFSPHLQSRLADSTGLVPWLSRASFSFYIAGVITSVVILWSLITIDRFLPSVSSGMSRSIRWVAEGTFTLYLFHLPLILLIALFLKGRPRAPWACAAGIVVFCVVLSSYLDRLKMFMRNFLRRRYSSRQSTKQLEVI